MKKSKDKYHNGGEKNKAAEYYVEHYRALKIIRKISIETCQKKEKKQKENMVEIDTET